MYILYEGPSVIDGGPIVALMTGVDSPSQNKKTGPMAQTWILRSDVTPTQAVKQEYDRSICGSCPHRAGTCYVVTAQSPQSIYHAYQRGIAKKVNLKKLGYNRRIRLGAYGDPAAVPTSIWQDLLTYADGWTGYTHSPLIQPDLKDYCMASADTLEQAELYQHMGWKTYRIKTEDSPVDTNEIICPSNKGIQCITCMKCNGKTQNITINVHGTQYKINKFKETLHA